MGDQYGPFEDDNARREREDRERQEREHEHHKHHEAGHEATQLPAEERAHAEQRERAEKERGTGRGSDPGSERSPYEKGFGPPLRGEDEDVYRKRLRGGELPVSENDITVISRQQVYPVRAEFDWDEALTVDFVRDAQEQLLAHQTGYVPKQVKLERVHNNGGQLLYVELRATYGLASEIKQLREDSGKQAEDLKRAQEQEAKYGEVGLTEPKDPAIAAAERGEKGGTAAGQLPPRGKEGGKEGERSTPEYDLERKESGRR